MNLWVMCNIERLHYDFPWGSYTQPLLKYIYQRPTIAYEGRNNRLVLRGDLRLQHNEISGAASEFHITS